MARRAAAWLAALALGAAPGLAADHAPYQVGDQRSGYTYLSGELQAEQDDDLGNPGMLWVERGADQWRTPAGSAGKSCASCHGDAATSMKGVRASYPKWNAALGKPIDLEQRINLCRTEQMGAAPLAWESDALIAITAYVGRQSLGMPVALPDDPRLEPYRKAGEAFYNQRRGQWQLACSYCHVEQAGHHLRGDLLSQGQTNGFPIYRLLWEGMGSVQRMFRWCNEGVRAEPYDYGSEEYIGLEIYLAERGRGLPVETPAVRR
jgi:L-cysteine S-thiosulfotransferase